MAKKAKAKAKKNPKKKVGTAKKKQVTKKKSVMMAAAADDNEARARELVRRALGLQHMVPDSTTLASLLIDDAASKAALAQSLRALGVHINDGPVIVCNKVGDVVKAVKARI
jgi:hypothetical protein